MSFRGLAAWWSNGDEEQEPRGDQLCCVLSGDEGKKGGERLLCAAPQRHRAAEAPGLQPGSPFTTHVSALTERLCSCDPEDGFEARWCIQGHAADCLQVQNTSRIPPDLEERRGWGSTGTTAAVATVAVATVAVAPAPWLLLRYQGRFWRLTNAGI